MIFHERLGYQLPVLLVIVHPEHNAFMFEKNFAYPESKGAGNKYE
jgi:hypothetical protein